MSNTPDNPSNPSPQDKGPWLYSGAQQPQPAYVPPAIPTPAPQQPTSPATESPVPLTPPPPPPPPAPPKKPPTPKPQTKSDDASLASIVDTIEAIIIALILALTFRAFIVEAFVIPTGSMAPTLLGAHFNVVCPACGYTFTRGTYLDVQRQGNRLVNLGLHAELYDNRTIPSDQTRFGSPYIYCPNCSFPIDPERLPQRLTPLKVEDASNGGSSHTIPFAWTNNGDRILVLKYLYALFEPHRFDVIVFKEPMNARDNYIKRLIALPGETVEVINGDVFIAPPGKSAPEDLLIARKPAYLQKNLWQIVFNNDYYPTDEGDARTDGSVWNNPWTGAGPTAAAWSAHNPVFRYTATTPGTALFNVRDAYTYNILGYDNRDMYELTTGDRNRNERGHTLLRSGDLRLETVWTPDDLASASISLSAGQRQNLFKAIWNSDGLDLQQFDAATHTFHSTEKISASQLPTLQAQHAYHVALDNVDHTVRVFIDDHLVLEHETKWTAADALREMREQLALPDPTDSSTKPDIQIDVGGACSLGHTKIFRDLYYTQSPNNSSLTHTANAENPLTLNPDEFFAMGDNSRDSEDGRLWNSVYPPLDDLGTREGIVPRRYLLGKAFFVYWPAGYRPDPTDSIPQPINIPIISNAGDMRLIR